MAGTQTDRIEYRISPRTTNAELNELFASAWPDYTPRDFEAILSRSLAYICAYCSDSPNTSARLIGFVNIAWDGGAHTFLLDTTVRSDFQRRGIGQELVNRAATAAKERGAVWLHVDYEPHLHQFYTHCGFLLTLAGLRRL